MAHEPDGVLDNGATPSTAVTLSGVTNIDAQLTGRKWTDYDLTYSFVDLASDISADYALLPSVIAGFSALSAAQETAARYWFDQYASISGLTFTELDGPEGALNEDEEATIRMFNNSNQATAFGYYPGNSAIAGDTYFGGTGDNPARYNFDWVTVGHEIGHTLGMDHGHEGLLLEPDNNSSEYSIMTYLTYVGDPGGINTAGPDNNPQTLMMADIQTIQYNYGANFGFNASNTTYTFSTTTGEMFVNGVGQVAGTGNKIFRTIWDGDGFDTYDLSNYTTDLLIDLRPGMHTDLDVGGNAQRADLDFFGTPNTHMARGHIFNAMQYNNDSRSLIESAIGGSGNDSIVGNDGNNALNGGSGDDTILGGEGNDTITDGLPSGGGASTQGNDIINAGAGNDIVRVNYVSGPGSYNGGADTDTLDIRGDNTAFIGVNAIDLGAASWTSWGSTFSQFEHITAGSGAHDITGSSDNNQVQAGGGNDTIRGEGGIDVLYGQGGIDQVFGGAGNDVILINTGDDGVGETYDGGADSDTIRVIAIGGGTIFNLRDDTVTSIERLDFTNLYNVSATVEMNASQVTLVEILATAHVGDTNKLNIFMNGASTLDLSGISISGFTEPGDGVMITGDTMLAQNIIGSMVNDTITGVGGENTIEGGLGNNDMDGGASRNDTASYAGAASGVTVDLGLTTAQNTGGAGTDTLTNFENLLGSANTDHLTGDNNDNRIEGGLEADTIMGLGGKDTLLGGEGDDLIKGGFGEDDLDGGLGTGDTLSFEGEERRIVVNMGPGSASALSTTIDVTMAPTTSAVLAAAELGNIYINVHTVDFTSGELRGQVGPILSDTTVGLVRTVVFENIALDPANEVPPVVSNASGIATLTMVDDNGTVTYSIGMVMGGIVNETLITGAHLHEAAAGSNGGVVANILGAGGVVSNSYERDTIANFENVIGGNGSDNLNGDALSNRLEGGRGYDTMDGGTGGPDTMVGGLGLDTYIIRNAGDTIIEVAGEGTQDKAQSFINFALAADDDIEFLEVHSSVSTATTRSLTGNALAQTITGHDGKNTLRDGADGMAGAADTMRGLDGDDTYRVNNSAAVVEENTGEGTDRVITYVNYALGAGQEIERLQTSSSTGTDTRSLQGNELSQYILGNNGRNTLRDGADGMAGAADTMVGLQGDDTYRVNNSGTEVREKVGEGTDRVITYVNYALGAGQEIERLQTGSSPGTSTRSLQGNELSQYILGNNGRNTLRDGADGVAGAADTMVGLGGDDTYRVNNSAAEVREKVGEGTDRVITYVNYALGAGQEIERLQTSSSTGTDTRSLQGNELAQYIVGNNGRNTLRDGADGVAGAADTMVGLGGDDTYRVNNSAAEVREKVGEGTDRVITYVNYALGAGQEIERLQTSSSTGTDTRSLQGNELAQYIVGNNGRNTLRDGADGVAGAADTMVGLGGDDTYRVNNSAAEVREKVGEGTDRVISYVNYALGAGQEIERLQTSSSTGTDNLNLTGNELAQYLLGNAGDNYLKTGGGAADYMRGLDGDDRYRVYNSGDSVVESAGQGTDRVYTSVNYALNAGSHVEYLQTNGSSGTSNIDLTGNELAQTVIGNSGNNRIDGKGGLDVLRGLGGNDIFVFSSALGAGNIDTVLDFNTADDQFELDTAIFSALSPGTLATSAFVANTTGQAQDASDRIIYNTTDGSLFYDADGNGAGTALQFASLSAGLSLSNSDFFIA